MALFIVCQMAIKPLYTTKIVGDHTKLSHKAQITKSNLLTNTITLIRNKKLIFQTQNVACLCNQAKQHETQSITCFDNLTRLTKII